MSVSIIRGTNNKPAASRELARIIAADPDLEGHLFIGYPIIGTSDGRYPIDGLLISPDKGIIVFDLIEGQESGDYASRQDDSANKLEARLKTHRELMDRRELLVPIHTVSFAPRLNDASEEEDGEYILATSGSLRRTLEGFCWQRGTLNLFNTALSTIQSISTIRKSRSRRTVRREDSRGAKLKRLEDSIATLDNLQSKAVIETVIGVQRIRGLAGSGKTIVLALKAAYLHAQHPDWRIAVTFNTRSLKGQFRRLINNFSVEQTGEEPDWDNLRVLNAWGAPGGGEREGIYHEFCQVHDMPYLDFKSARGSFGSGKEFFGVCEQAISQLSLNKPCYDAILIDEAQDFPPEFLRLCYEMLDEHKRLVYAYDELQNLGGESLPAPEEIFGYHPNGSPRVRFDTSGRDEPRQDILLDTCYRNSRPVLVTAHSLGFGIYRQPPDAGAMGLVQMFNYAHLWQEIGYHLKDGELRDGQSVRLCRTQESSPVFLEEHSPIDDLVQFRCFRSEVEQAEWLVEAIRANLQEDELRHDDIVVINPDPISTREKVGLARRRLLEMGISSHLAGVDTEPDVFFQPDMASVTFTGIFRAKGNESGMVYVINAQDCQSSSWNLARIRNRLFTAITRSKAWVRVIGVGDGMEKLIEEYERLKEQDFELRFTYPTEAQREHLKVVHRDMTLAERKRLKTREKELTDLLDDLDCGNVHPEELSEEVREKLVRHLTRKVSR